MVLSGRLAGVARRRCVAGCSGERQRSGVAGGQRRPRHARTARAPPLGSGWGRLDGALVSVGGPPLGGVTEITDEQWSAAFDVGVPGGGAAGPGCWPASWARAARSPSCLSTSVRSPLPDLAVSNGLRPGLAMIAKTLADELGAARRARERAAPGRDPDRAAARLSSGSGGPGGVRSRSGRYGEPAEFGRAAAFLLSPAASYVSGVMLPVRRRGTARASSDPPARPSPRAIWALGGLGLEPGLRLRLGAASAGGSSRSPRGPLRHSSYSR